MFRSGRWWSFLFAFAVAGACELNPQPEVPAFEDDDAGKSHGGGTGGLLNSGGYAGIATGSGAHGGTLDLDGASDSEPAFNDADGDAAADEDGDVEDAGEDATEDASEDALADGDDIDANPE